MPTQYYLYKMTGDDVSTQVNALYDVGKSMHSNSFHQQSFDELLEQQDKLFKKFILTKLSPQQPTQAQFKKLDADDYQQALKQCSYMASQSTHSLVLYLRVDDNHISEFFNLWTAPVECDIPLTVSHLGDHSANVILQAAYNLMELPPQYTY